MKNINYQDSLESKEKDSVWGKYINIVSYFLLSNYILDILVILSLFIYHNYNVLNLQLLLLVGVMIAIVSKFDFVRYAKYAAIKVELKQIRFW